MWIVRISKFTKKFYKKNTEQKSDLSLNGSKNSLHFIYLQTMAKTPFSSVEHYLQSFDGEALQLLQQLHNCILKAAPRSSSCIAYNMPAFKQGKIIAYYAGYKNHIGFYPLPKCILHFEDQLKPYKTSKGAVQFSLLEPLPIDLISKMIQFNLDALSLNEK